VSWVRGAAWAVLAVGLGLGAGFAAGAVIERPLAALDRALLVALRSPEDPAQPIGPSWLAVAVRDVTALGGHTLTIAVAAIVATYLAIIRRRKRAIMIAVTVVGAAFLGGILKLGAGRARPDIVAPLVDVYSLSFPSSHALLAAVVYPTIGAMLAGTQSGLRARIYVMSVAILVTLLVGSTRIYLGVHWPTDVIAGWLIGGAWAAICWWVAIRIEPSRYRG
jgi:undecaprenyl-diphosphatase